MAKKIKPKTALARLLEKPRNDVAEDIGSEVVGITYNKEANHNNDIHVESSEFIKDKKIPTIKLINPNDCCLWSFANRPEDEYGDIKELANAIVEHGQQEPILVRPSKNNKQAKYEIIFGNRRWNACKLANVEIIAIVKDINDQQASICQNEENEKRKDLSDFAKARSYRKLIESGVFTSERELGKKLGISHSTFSDIMAFTRVPDELMKVIPNFKDVSRKTVVMLAKLAKEEKNRTALISLGSKIGNGYIHAENMQLILDKKMSNKKIKYIAPIVVNDENGKMKFNISITSKGAIHVKFHHELSKFIDKNMLQDILEKHLVSIAENLRNNSVAM